MGLSIVAVTINCRDPRSLAEWWAETLDEGEITQDLGEYVFVHAGRVELGFQGVAAAARERIRLHLDLEARAPALLISTRVTRYFDGW
jgi:Glyoxalase-like domain